MARWTGSISAFNPLKFSSISLRSDNPLLPLTSRTLITEMNSWSTTVPDYTARSWKYLWQYRENAKNSPKRKYEKQLHFVRARNAIYHSTEWHENSLKIQRRDWDDLSNLKKSKLNEKLQHLRYGKSGKNSVYSMTMDGQMAGGTIG